MARLRRQWGIQTRRTPDASWRPATWGWQEEDARRYVRAQVLRPDCVVLVSRIVGDVEVVEP